MSNYISEDILVLVFKHLPVTTLLRFQSVCRDWKQLINSPDLVQEHLSIQKPRFIVEHVGEYLLVDPRPRPLVNTLSKPIEKNEFLLFGTLHGVVCLYDYYRCNLLLWNPSIRRLSSLRLPLGFNWYFGGKFQTCYGFWIHPSSKEFKIIILQRKPVVNCILYSSIREDWSVIPTEKLVNWSSCKEGPPVMIGSVAHWGGCLDEHVGVYHSTHEHMNKVLLSFDFVQECFEVIELPNPARFYKTASQLPDMGHYHFAPCRWQGTLAIVYWSYKFSCRCIMFSRKEDSWVGMFDLESYEHVVHVFWAMEDTEERKKRGKRKRGVEGTARALLGETQDNVRVLATIVYDPNIWAGSELIFQGTKSGSKTVMRGLNDDQVNMAYDFVESLLFP